MRLRNAIKCRAAALLRSQNARAICEILFNHLPYFMERSLRNLPERQALCPLLSVNHGNLAGSFKRARPL